MGIKTSEDLIKRSDAITAVAQLCAWHGSEGAWVLQEDVIEALENVTPNEPKQEWIPCSERLPEENEEVLVCDEDGTMEVCDLEMFEMLGRDIGLKWTDKNGYECWLDVVAWMPLPEPYKEGE